MDRHSERQGEGKNGRRTRPCWRGDELRALRQWAGSELRRDGRALSQFQLAEEIKASERAVRTWEADDCILIQPALIENLDAFAKRIGFPQSGTEDDMKRSAFLAGGAALVASRLLPAPSSTVDERYVASLADETMALEARYCTGHLTQLMHSAIGHYQTCVSLLDHTATHTAHRQLLVVAGATAEFVGILARETGLWAWSRQYAAQALDLAQEADHEGLQARASSDLGVLYSPLLGDGTHVNVHRCVEQAEHAHHLARRFSPPAMRSWAAAQLALAYAVDGQRVEAQRALLQAAKNLGGEGGGDDLGDRFVGMMDETTLALFEGEGLLALGEAQPAIQRLEDALNSNLSQWATVKAMTTLADAYTNIGDRFRGANLLAEARAIATTHDYVLELQHIEAVSQHS